MYSPATAGRSERTELNSAMWASLIWPATPPICTGTPLIKREASGTTISTKLGSPVKETAVVDKALVAASWVSSRVMIPLEREYTTLPSDKVDDENCAVAPQPLTSESWAEFPLPVHAASLERGSNSTRRTSTPTSYWQFQPHRAMRLSGVDGARVEAAIRKGIL